MRFLLVAFAILFSQLSNAYVRSVGYPKLSNGVYKVQVTFTQWTYTDRAAAQAAANNQCKMVGQVVDPYKTSYYNYGGYFYIGIYTCKRL